MKAYGAVLTRYKYTYNVPGVLKVGDWYAAIIHILTTGLVGGGLLLAVGFLFPALFDLATPDTIIYLLINQVWTLVAIIPGTFISSLYLKKHYVPESLSGIIIRATILVLIIEITRTTLRITFSELTTALFFEEVVNYLVSIGGFFLMSKLFLATGLRTAISAGNSQPEQKPTQTSV